MSEPIEMMETPETPKISYKYRTQHLRGTTAQWEEYGEDFIPLAGEIVIEFDDEHSLHKLKIGDGNTSYHDLAYVMAGEEVITQVLPRVITVTLNANEWQLIDDANDPKYGWSYQELSIDQIQINDEIIIDNPITQQSRLDLQPTADLIDEFKRLQLNFTTENNKGTMYIYSSGNLPTKDYTMQATIVETNVEEGTDIIVGVPIIASPIVENSYDPTSDHAQSGQAIAEALDTIRTPNGTVVSHNADFAEVVEWADGNPSEEDRTGYFVCANIPLNGIIMKKATSIDDVKGVTIKNPAFAGNYTKDKLDSNGNLLPKYSYVAIIGFVPVRDNGTCTVGGRCMPDDNGCAIPSRNSMGYQVVNRIDENRVLIIIEPNGDMVQRIKTRVDQMQEDIDNLAPDQTFDPTSENAQSGKAVNEAIGETEQRMHNEIIQVTGAYSNDIASLKTADNLIRDRLDNLAPDQTYSATSENAQSGKAVAEALDGLKTINGESLVGEGDIVVKAANVDSTYTPNSDNAQSGKAVKGALDTLKTINGQSLVGGGDIIVGANGTINIDEAYTPDSSNAQSGKAVKNALDSLKTVNGQSLVGGGNIVIDTVDVDDTFVPDSSKPQSGKAVADALTSYTTKTEFEKTMDSCKEYIDNIAKNPILDYITYEKTNNNTITITSCDTNMSGNYIIPDFIDGYTVTQIKSRAFEGCLGLTGIIIPDSITSIGELAFSGCQSLRSAVIGNGITSIGQEIFKDCISLNNITIPNSVISIGTFAFSDCKSLTSITIPNSVTSIGDEAFARCRSITNIKIPDSVTSIGNGVFYGCTSLTGITIPDGVTNIGYQAFADCTRLTGITILNGVTDIGDVAFCNCTRLTNISIPDSVTSIGQQAFNGCSNLTDVYYKGTEEQWNSISIGNTGNECLNNATIHYNQIVVKKDYVDSQIIENKTYIDNKIKVYSSEEDIDENLPEGTIIFITE